MKKIFIKTVLLCCCAITMAQQTPMWEMPLYFEDAMGNKDTLVIGYDTEISQEGSYNVDSAYGEILDTSRFDTIFDIRSAHIDKQINEADHPSYGYNFVREKTITSYELYTGNNPNDCGVALIFPIFMHTKYPPLTISWNPEDLSSRTGCDKEMVFVNVGAWASVWNWDEIPEWTYCISGNSSMVEDFDYLNQGNSPPPAELYTTLELNNGLRDTVPYFVLSINSIGDYCQGVSINEVEQTKNYVNTYPNPCTGSTQVSLPEATKVKSMTLYNSIGQEQNITYTHNGSSLQLNTKHLAKGIYTGRILTKEAPLYFKFLKE